MSNSQKRIKACRHVTLNKMHSRGLSVGRQKTGRDVKNLEMLPLIQRYGKVTGIVEEIQDNVSIKQKGQTYFLPIKVE